MALTSFTAGNSPYEMQFMVQRAVGEYSQEAYTNARKLSGTAIVGADASVNTDIEDYIGQLRWYKTLAPEINVASATTATAGTTTEISSAFAKYVKTVRTHGARQVNVQSVISQEDGLAKIGRDFGETRAQDEHNSILESLNGVARFEEDRGGGLISFATDADNATTGFYVDINAAGEFGAAATGTGDQRKLIDSTAAGAAKGERLFRALGMAWKDYEAPYYYLLTDPGLMADLRTANLVDQTVVTEGNLVFSTIFNGKFRILQSRASTVDVSAGTNSNAFSVKTTFLIKPNALTMKELTIPMPVEVDRSAAAYFGGGTTDIWYRWGYVLHPMGYDWSGAETAFVAKAGAGGYDQAASWARADMGYLNLGVLPILHG